LKDNVGEDSLSYQSTYKDNIQDFDASGLVVTSLLEHHPPPTPLLTNIYGVIIKVLNEMRVDITLKKTLHVIDRQSRSINAKIAEVQAKDVFFPILTILDW
jgi:hypothetical protein